MKFIVIFLLLLTSCSTTNIDNNSDIEFVRPSSDSSYSQLEGDIIQADSDSGYAIGFIGDVMRSAFMDFKINEAYLCDSYDGYTPDDNKVLLVVDISIANTMITSLPMYDDDFDVEWNIVDSDNGGYSFPIRQYISGDTNLYESYDVISKDQLPVSYTIGINEVKQGLLIFEVDKDINDFMLGYKEDYQDSDTSGNVFGISFSAYIKE